MSEEVSDMTPETDAEASVAVDKVVEDAAAAENVAEQAAATTERSEVDTGEATEQAEEFAMVWPEGYEATEQFSAITTEAAKAVGLSDGRVAGEYTAKVLAAIGAAADKKLAEDDAALKEDWGADYQANMSECKDFVKRISAKAGLSEDDVAVLGSPKGMRLIQAIRSELGEGAAAVGKAATGAEDAAWAREVMTNPAHPDYKAFHNPTDPRWKDLNKRYNAVKGF